VKVMLINHGEAPFTVRRGDRIAQMVVAPVSAVSFEEQETLDDTARGDKGHGSTGR
jgi:dUTP pyrophosphatase